MKQQVYDIAEVLRRLSAQIESMQKTIDSQHAALCRLNCTSQGQLKKIQNLERLLKKKDRENQELRKRLSKYEEPPKNSGSSSTPPLKEPMKDEIVRRTKSLRRPSGKKPRVQPGHEGNTLELTDDIDNIMEESADVCDACGNACEIVISGNGVIIYFANVGEHHALKIFAAGGDFIAQNEVCFGREAEFFAEDAIESFFANRESASM